MVRIRHLLLLPLLLLGCPSETEEPPTPAPRIVVSPALIDFGELSAPAEQELTITNEGDADLGLLGLTLFPFDAFELETDTLPTVLGPGDEIEATVRYLALRDEHAEAVVTVVSDDWTAPRIEVSVTAEGLQPSVEVDPAQTDLGSLQIGCVRVVPITLTNVGRAPAVLNNIWFEDLGHNGEMTLIHSIPAGAVLMPGDDVSAEVHYVPTDVDPDTGVLHVETNDPESPDVTARVTGLGHSVDPVTDTFVQEGPSGLDLLFVADAADRFEAAELAPIFQILDALGSDYQVGVVSTSGGSLLGRESVITAATAGPESALEDAFGEVTNPSHEGFDAVQRCFANSVDGCAAGFDRGDTSVLHVVFVTPQSEQSSSLPSPAEFLPFLNGLRTDPGHVIASDISGGLSGCAGSTTAAAGPEYVEVTAAKGGVSASWCDSNTTAILAALAWAATLDSDTFELSRPAIEDSVRVTINGTDSWVGWTFNSALNAIFFDLSHIPAPGDEVVVTYTPLEGCN